MYKIGAKNHSFFLNVLKILRIDFYTFLVFLSVLISCKKEQSAIPVVSGEITNPQNGFNCNFGDTIVVAGNFSCDYPIQSAYLSLRDPNLNTIITGKLIGENLGTTHQFATEFILDNPDAASGNYQLKISIRSERETIFLDNTVVIHVNSVPRTTLKTFCVTGTNSYFNLHELTGGSSVILNSYTSSFLNMHIDGRYKKIYLCSKEKVRALNSETYQEQFQLSPLALNSDSFVTSELYSNKLNLGRNDGNIIQYNLTGQRIAETGENLFFRPLLTTTTSDHLYSSILKNTDRKISVFFFPSGDARQELLVDFDIVNFHPVSANEIIVVGNRNGHLLICKYFLNTNGIQVLSDSPNTFCNSTLSYNGVILLLTNSGLLNYEYPANTLQTRNSGIFMGANYDEVNDILYCFSGSNIKQLNGTSYADLGDQMMPDSVMAVSVLYSK